MGIYHLRNCGITVHIIKHGKTIRKPFFVLPKQSVNGTARAITNDVGKLKNCPFIQHSVYMEQVESTLKNIVQEMSIGAHQNLRSNLR
ncbi:hypothetical protein OUZ56_015631 [Daphnia magna]|uniref:Uncharacterized protein n=1 Tax=Daphnia magna TaxID=35525 RepID=A0ABR0ANC9_9CRUS|nr:hypothetical protein OUZ56_015631 [Daphnia magna]